MDSWLDSDWLTLSALLPWADYGLALHQFASKISTEHQEDGAVEWTTHDGQELCTITTDEDGIIHSVVFTDERAVIDAVRCGMTFEEVTKRLGPLTLEFTINAIELKASHDCDSYLATRDEATRWDLVFSDDALFVLCITSVEEDDEPLRRDPHFADLNLKLVVLEHLSRAGLITLPELEQTEDTAHAAIDDEEADYAAQQDQEDALLAIELTQELLDQLTTLEVDAGHAIYQLIDPDWDGESYRFDIVSLEGVEHLRNLRSLRFASMTTHLDLRPLAHHPALEHLTLSYSPFKHLSALLDVPKLKTLTGHLHVLDDPEQEAIEALQQRGVTVKSDTLD